jgi:hypothetical protein
VRIKHLRLRPRLGPTEIRPEAFVPEPDWTVFPESRTVRSWTGCASALTSVPSRGRRPLDDEEGVDHPSPEPPFGSV